MLEFIEEFGWGEWIRTTDPPPNRLSATTFWNDSGEYQSTGSDRVAIFV